MATPLLNLHQSEDLFERASFELPDSVREVQLAAREFVDSAIRPRVAQNDAAPHDEFDWELVQAGHDFGLFRMIIPSEFGGMGLGILAVAVTLEEIASACAGTALIFGATMLGQAPILLSGDPHLQARFLPMFCGDEPALACNAITESLAGCDMLIPENAQFAEEVMPAVPDGDPYVLTGRKRFITNARVARFASVYANLEGYLGATGLTGFIVPLDSPGVIQGPVADKMGYRACLGSELIFDGVRVPRENVIAGECNGMLINIQQMNMARATVAAISTAVARGAFDLAKAWAGERVQGGKLLYQHQFSARKLAEMSAKSDAARLRYQ